MSTVRTLHDNTNIWVRQQRLNHKPFTVTINAVSDKQTEVLVRMYLGPKFDSKGKLFKLNENRLNFFELDEFVHTSELQSYMFFVKTLRVDVINFSISFQ